LLLPDGNSSSSNKSLLLLTDDEVRQMLLPLSPPLYDMDALTDRTERFVASEIIRAALFQSLKKELPYCCEVQVTAFKEPVAGDKKPVIRIAATVIVERDSQKAIVIGKNGEQIKKVGMLAREKLQDFLQSQVRWYCLTMCLEAEHESMGSNSWIARFTGVPRSKRQGE
jgi:GTPase Era involved in 16S rRNA processing